MGTRRSRHNAGRKPLYKEVDRSTIRAADDTHSKQGRPVPTAKPAARKPQPAGEVELTAEVERYLAARKAENVVTSSEKKNIAAQFGDLIELDEPSVRKSRRDILLQMFCSKTIDIVQFRAGRMWQHYMEEATIQALRSFDPGSPIQKQFWQKDGDLSEGQYRAARVRRIAAPALGYAAIRFLDRILEPDVGIPEAALLAKMSRQHVAYVLSSLLRGLSIYFGYRTGNDNPVFSAFHEASIARERYRAEWNLEMDKALKTPPSVAVALRRLQQEDTAANA